MGYSALVPQAPLSHLVEMIWDWQAAPQAHRLERILPVANAGIIINLAEDETRVYDEQRQCHWYASATLDGPRTISSIIDSEEQVAVMGVVFRPGAAALFFRQRMDQLANTSVGLEELAGRSAAYLREQLLHATHPPQRLMLLQRWLQQRKVTDMRDCAVRHTLSALHSDPRVATMAATARELQVSPRTLGERFRHTVGMTPKRYLRLQRFHRVVAITRERERIDWAGIGADCGYADQAHLAHEFREFSGMTPTAYSRHAGPWGEHIALD